MRLECEIHLPEEKIMDVVFELLKNMSHSTVPGIFGVLGIFTYLAAIVVAAIYRIREGMQQGHH